MRKLLTALLGLYATTVFGQTEFYFEFKDKSLTSDKAIKLQAFEYLPKNWNGKVILFSHGSTGMSRPDLEKIKHPTKYLNISKYATANGYIFVPYMRKGRGGSEGDFTEENGNCGWGTNEIQQKEAMAQLAEVVEQVKKKYGVSKVILMGHSRGGLLSARYAEEKSNDVLAVVNLAGVWNAACEDKNGQHTRAVLTKSAKAFKPQLWAYYEEDSYFATGRFGDWNYSWLKKTASENEVTLNVYPRESRKDGHETPTYLPKAWATDYFPLLNALAKN